MAKLEDRQFPGTRKALATFLAAELGIPESEMPPPGSCSECGQTLGALALRLGALSLDQIDAIIDFQSAEPMLFGEIASELGFLTPTQVERLLVLQEFHRGLELAELLVLQGRFELPRLCELLAAFSRRQPR